MNAVRRMPLRAPEPPVPLTDRRARAIMYVSMGQAARFTIPIIIWGLCIMSCRESNIQNSKTFPSDLRIQAMAGGVDPWQESSSILVTADGKGLYTRAIPGDIGKPPLEQVAFKVDSASLREIWRVVEKTEFFTLKSQYMNERVSGGYFASLTVTAGGRTHSVQTQNSLVAPFDTIMAGLNRISPEGKKIRYGGLGSAQ